MGSGDRPQREFEGGALIYNPSETLYLQAERNRAICSAFTVLERKIKYLSIDFLDVICYNIDSMIYDNISLLNMFVDVYRKPEREVSG